MTASELLACPFCGSCGDMLLIERLEGTDIHPAYRVVCDNCGASSRYTDKDHITAWNTRPQLPAADGVDALDAARFRWLAKRAMDHHAHDRYGNGCHWNIGFYADDGRMAFAEAIDAAIASRQGVAE